MEKEKAASDMVFSRSISWLNALLSVLIVFLHTNFSGKVSPNIPMYGVYEGLHKLLCVMADCAVGAFFVVSAYLFYRSFAMEGGRGYVRKLKSRVHTIVVPYLLWSGIGLLYKLGVSASFRAENLQGVRWATAWILAEGNEPLWYLRTLFFFVVATPLIDAALRSKKWSVLMVPALAGLNVFLPTGYTTGLFWLPLYLLGAWAGIYLREEVEGNQGVQKRMKSLRMRGGVVCAVVILIFYGLLFFESRGQYYLYRMCSGIMVVLLFLYMPWRGAPPRWLQHSFYVYCVHACILGISTQGFSRLFGQNGVMLSVGYVFSAAMTYAVAVASAQLLKQFAPHMYALLTGGRKERE